MAEQEVTTLQPIVVKAASYETTQNLKYPKDLQSKTRGHFINFYVYYTPPTAYSEDILSDTFSMVSSGFDSLTNSDITAPKSLSGGALSSINNSLGSALKGVSSISSNISNFAFKTTRINSSEKKTLKTISLYMPDTINTNQSIDWQTVDLTRTFGLVGLAAQVAPNLVNQETKGATSILSQAVSRLSSDPQYQNAAIEIGGNLLDRSDISDILLSKTGFAINPQLQVLFKSVDLRTFQYQFSFTPTSEEEAKEIQKIITSFRMYSAPRINNNIAGGRYFETPCTFGIEYQFLSGDSAVINPYLHKIKDCVLQTVYVDYSPNGWTTFRDGMPTQITMILQFKETEVIDQDKINSGY